MLYNDIIVYVMNVQCPQEMTVNVCWDAEDTIPMFPHFMAQMSPWYAYSAHVN